MGKCINHLTLHHRRSELEQRYEGAAAESGPKERVVPRPPHWGGYRVTAAEILNFGKVAIRDLHDRLRFERATTSRCKLGTLAVLPVVLAHERRDSLFLQMS